MTSIGNLLTDNDGIGFKYEIFQAFPRVEHQKQVKKVYKRYQRNEHSEHATKPTESQPLTEKVYLAHILRNIEREPCQTKRRCSIIHSS